MTLLFITEGKFCSVSRCYICTDLTPFSSPPQVAFTGGGAGREKVERLFEFQAPRMVECRMGLCHQTAVASAEVLVSSGLGSFHPGTCRVSLVPTLRALLATAGLPQLSPLPRRLLLGNAP